MAQAFHEVQFPPDISYGVTGGPEYSTDVVVTGSGYEQRNINWAQARCKYQAAHGVKNENQMKQLLAFFRNRKGRAYGFRFKDHSDYKGEFEGLGWADGTTTNFPLVKNYEDAALNIADVRKIKKPVAGTTRIYFQYFDPAIPRTWELQTNIRKSFAVSIPAGAQQIGNWTIDITTGMIAFSTPPPLHTIILASFEFDVPVRFDTDHCPQSIKDWNIYGWDNIPLVEIRI